MKKLFLALPLALCVSNAVHAATDNPWYAGARIGVSHLSDMSKAVTSVTDVENNNFAGGVFMGYQVSPWFAVEGGYTHLGNADLENGQGSYEAQGADLVAKLSYSLNDDFDLFMKLGTYYYDWNAIGTNVDKNHNSWAPTAGVGAEYFINQDWSTRIEYQYYSEVGGPDIHFAGVSFAYHWGAPVATSKPIIAEPVVTEPVMVEQSKIVTLEALSLTVPFAYDSADITSGDASLLTPFEARLKEQDAAQIVVIGHTDSRGSEAYNQKLSEKRATAVAEALRDHLNLDASRIVIEGQGENNPVATNDTEQGRAANRRVEIISPSLDVEVVTKVAAQ